MIIKLTNKDENRVIEHEIQQDIFLKTFMEFISNTPETKLKSYIIENAHTPPDMLEDAWFKYSHYYLESNDKDFTIYEFPCDIGGKQYECRIYSSYHYPNDPVEIILKHKALLKIDILPELIPNIKSVMLACAKKKLDASKKYFWY